MGLTDADGCLREGQREMEVVTIDYFSDLFKSSNPSNFEQILDAVERRVTPAMKNELLRPFCEKEVTTAMRQIHPTKAPGPDGLSAVFFQSFWNIIGHDVVAFCLDFLNGNGRLASVNETNITLIPKINEPKAITHFRPISLCNVIYKIVLKTLTNRLKLILPACIGEWQSTFVPGRLITDNVLVAYEILHALKAKKKRRQGYVAVKLDMSKTYDRVEWTFFEAMMRKMGFNERWIYLMVHCMSTVRYHVILNGNVSYEFFPEKGLQQGDPLSPYLFLFYSEGLSVSITKLKSDNVLKGVKACARGPSITHFFFADDSFLFLRENSMECNIIKDLLGLYEMKSGQKVNFDKFDLFFSPNTCDSSRTCVKNIFEIQDVCNPEKYLGLLSVLRRDK